MAVGGRRREVKGEGDGGRARGDRDDGVADDLAAGRRAEGGGGGGGGLLLLLLLVLLLKRRRVTPVRTR